MPQVDDLSRCLLPLDQQTTMMAVVELSQSSWLVAGLLPDVDRQPLKKIEPDPITLLHLLERWRSRSTMAGRRIGRVALAYEAGRDGFWLARWPRLRGIEVHVIHPTSVAVSREHKRAKTDRLDTAMLMRVFLGWPRGERGHCGMVAIPTLEEEDAKRPSRERENLVGERTRIINRVKAALARLGIRGFKPELCKASERLETLRTPEELPIPANMLDEIRRDLARLSVAREQIGAIERSMSAPTSRTTAGSFGKMPTTSARRLISRLSRSSGFVEAIWAQCSRGKLMYTSTSSREASMSSASLGKRSRSVSATCRHWAWAASAASCAKIVFSRATAAGRCFGCTRASALRIQCTRQR